MLYQSIYRQHNSLREASNPSRTTASDLKVLKFIPAVSEGHCWFKIIGLHHAEEAETDQTSFNYEPRFHHLPPSSQSTLNSIHWLILVSSYTLYHSPDLFVCGCRGSNNHMEELLCFAWLQITVNESHKQFEHHPGARGVSMFSYVSVGSFQGLRLTQRDSDSKLTLDVNVSVYGCWSMW